MSRCDFEGIFYRVFCVSLLIIAFTFTVILTNVFVDIEGLLNKKEQESQATEHATPSSFVDKFQDNINDWRPPPRDYVGANKDYDDDGVYRTKRSLDTTDFLLHIKNPKIKNVLANRLATLLEELDEDESRSEITEPSEKPLMDFDDIYIKTDKQATKEVRHKAVGFKKQTNVSERDDNGLHAAMHNLLREGIVGHMDLNSVYKKVHALVRSFKNADRKQKENGEIAKYPTREKFEEVTIISPTTAVNEEIKFLEELTSCTKLKQEVMDLTKEKKKEDVTKANVKSPKFLIKTLIDIQKNDKENDNSKENFKGIIKLIYNGKSIKIKSMDEYESTTVKPNKEETTPNTPTKDADEISDLLKINMQSNKRFTKSSMDTLLTEYLKKYTKIHDAQEPLKGKRLKRNIKSIDLNQTDKNKKTNDKIDDDELFVEIETHFDNKGIKGKKKEELVKQLIEKIQKAIRSNQEENKQLKHLHEIHVKKRIQNPLDHKNESHHLILKDVLLPSVSNIYRELYPISKISTGGLDPLPTVSNSNDWIKKEMGPKFISPSKSINSAELSQIDVDFKKTMDVSGVPQRLQIPLNTDLSSENPNAYFDLGNLQFLIKDLEGSGFSIGVNQYVDHAPDPESIKLFTGIENLINKYYHKNDQNVLDGHKTEVDDRHEMKKREVKMKKNSDSAIETKNKRPDHKISKRSVSGRNEYNFLYQDNNLPYNNYQDIFEGKQKKISVSIDNKYQDLEENEISTRHVPTDFEHIFEKKLKPSEIFNLASLLDRKKRSVSVQRFKNVNKKLRLSTYINTNAMAKQRIFFKGKRNKRQIGKIRIIAKDTKADSESDENYYIVSGEKLYADRAVIRRMNVPNISGNENKAEEQLDEPILFENTKPPLFNMFEESVRRNPLMLRYPHVFLDDINDKFSIQAPTKFGMINQPMGEYEMTTENDVVLEKMPKVQDLVNALTPFPKANYKVTLKILPKDSNVTNTGFREVHTSINKTFNKNGILYSSLVNVSEISKIEHSNDTNSANLRNRDDDKLNVMLATTPNPTQNKHEELKSVIKEHRERINKQLANLHKEKEKLNSMILNHSYDSTTERKPDLLDMLLNSNQNKVLRLNKDDIGKLICNSINDKAKTATVTTMKPDLTTPKIMMDPLKVKLLKAISQNEQLTSQILSKIDENSIILQSFLAKITDKIQELPDITRQAILDHEKKTEIPQENHHSNHPDPRFTKQNATNLGVPLIYYQQPNSQRTKDETPVANTVYNSYTNQNPVVVNNKVDTPNTDEFKTFNEVPTANVTKYFVDDDYFRTYVSPVDKIEQKATANASPIGKASENKNVKPYKFKSNAPKNITMSG